jgi:hypothetical protein
MEYRKSHRNRPRTNAPAVGAESLDLEAVVELREAVMCGEAIDPLVERALVELDDPVAASAHEMVVVRVAAQAVTELAAVMCERVDDSVIPE